MDTSKFILSKMCKVIARIPKNKDCLKEDIQPFLSLNEQYKGKYLIFTTLLVFYAMLTPSMASAACSEAELQEFPAAAEAANNWASSHDLVLTQPVLDDVVRSFCAAALSAKARRHIDDEMLNHLALKVMPDYLDLELNADNLMKSMSVVLNGALGSSGLPKPVPRKYSALNIKYDQGVMNKPDSLRVNGLPQKLGDKPLMITAGPVNVEGIFSKQPICHGVGNAEAGIPLEVVCKK